MRSPPLPAAPRFLRGGREAEGSVFCKPGRSAVLTTDCAPHWAPPEFCEWEGYERLFANLAAWLIK